MRTIIVSISTDCLNSRKVCELIQNQPYSTLIQLKNELREKLELEDLGEVVGVYELNDFMDEMNNQTFDVEGTFITYVEMEEYFH